MYGLIILNSLLWTQFISPFIFPHWGNLHSHATSVTYWLLGNKGWCHYSFHPSVKLPAYLCLCPTHTSFSFLWEWSVLYLTGGSGINPLPRPNTATACAILSQRLAARTAPQRRPWPQLVWNSVFLQARWVWSILLQLIYAHCWWQIGRKLAEW